MIVATVPKPRTLTCPTCKDEVQKLVNGACPSCYAAWEAKMAIRQDASKFDAQRLINLLLTQHWMHECEIVPDYMPPFPREGTRPTCQVRYTYESGAMTFLRHSSGPLQGFFWDVYGADMHTPELALIAISQAPAPTHVGRVLPTHGR